MGSGKRPHRVISDAPLPLPISIGSSFPLSSSDSHHIRDVLRASVGQPLDVCDQQSNRSFRCTIIRLSPDVVVEFNEELPSDSAHMSSIHLIFALCKGEKNDNVVDWATELGVASITFFQAERSIVRLRDDRDRHTRKERLSKIARSAAQQSKRTSFPDVTLLPTLQDCLAQVPPESVKLTCSLAPDAIPLQTAVGKNHITSSVHVVIGPEGDLTPKEEALLDSAGFIRASLGTTVLRAELAVVAAILLTRFSTDT